MGVRVLVAGWLGGWVAGWLGGWVAGWLGLCVCACVVDCPVVGPAWELGCLVKSYDSRAWVFQLAAFTDRAVLGRYKHFRLGPLGPGRSLGSLAAAACGHRFLGVILCHVW